MTISTVNRLRDKFIGLRISYYISKFAENYSAINVSIVAHLSITTFFRTY